MISPVRQWWRSVLKVVYAKFASPSSPFTLSPPFPLPTLPSLKSRPPLIQLEGLGSAVSSPSGVWGRDVHGAAAYAVRSHDREDSSGGKRSIKVGGICYRSRCWAWSERVMDDESGDDDRDELTSEWGGELRHDWRGWRNESDRWLQRRGDAYLNERSDFQRGDDWRSRIGDKRV